MTLATNLEERAPDPVSTGPDPTMAALIAWRTAERQLASIPAGSPEGDALRAEIEAQRLLYKQLSGQFAAQATPVARTTPVAQLVPVMEPTPVAEAAEVVPAAPLALPNPAARAKPATRAKPAVRLKPQAESARAS